MLMTIILMLLIQYNMTHTGYYVIEERLMCVTAYCPCERCCGDWADGVTASGAPAIGCLVAAPPSFPFQTPLIIPGYNDEKVVKVLDRGGAIVGERLDTLFPTHTAALCWGKQYLYVQFLDEWNFLGD
jgi:3D (Asp-Asp-Asp) domain-containing protein